MTSIESRIRTALNGIVDVVEPIIYMGDAKEYIVFNYDEYPAIIADSTTETFRCLIQMHYYLPIKQNPRLKKAQIIEAITGAGFTVPAVTNASDEEGQHYVFECEGIEVI